MLKPQASGGCIWRQVFKEVVKVKWDHKEGILTQQDCCPFKRWKRHQGCIQRRVHGRTPWEGQGHWQSLKGSFKRNWICQKPWSWNSRLRTVRNTFLLWKSPSLRYFDMTVTTNQPQINNTLTHRMYFHRENEYSYKIFLHYFLN